MSRKSSLIRAGIQHSFILGPSSHLLSRHCQQKPQFAVSSCFPRRFPHKKATFVRHTYCSSTKERPCSLEFQNSFVLHRKSCLERPKPSLPCPLVGFGGTPLSCPRRSSNRRIHLDTMVFSSNVGIALVLTCVGSFSTALGGLLVILQRVPDMKRLGLLQGFASGLMLSLSFFDLVPNAIQAIGFTAANVWFFSGCLLFAGVVTFIPEPNLLPDAVSDAGDKDNGKDPASKDPSAKDPTSKAAVVASSPRKGEAERELTRKRRKAVMYSGIVTAVGISMHNFPEGIAVFLGSMKGLRVGISLAVAIALHNIPEGLAVALPIYYATRNRWVAFRAAALSGLAEPLAVVFVALFFPGQLAPELIEGMLAGVGGIMAFLTLHEMLPLAFEYAGHKTAVSATFVGMAVMSANLQLLAMTLPADVAL